MNCTSRKRLTQRAPDPWVSTRTVVVGVGAFSGSLCGSKPVPAKLRYLIPPTSPHQGAARRVTRAVSLPEFDIGVSEEIGTNKR